MVVSRIAISLPAHVEAEDLHSAGLMGLLDALRRYNPESGASYPTYARLRIRGAVLDELRRMDWVPRTVHEKARKVQAVMQRLEQEIGDVPVEEEMAEALDMTVTEYRNLLIEIRPTTFVCLDAVTGTTANDGQSNGESFADEELLGPDRATELREHAGLLAQRIEQLPDAQRKVLALYYYEDLTLREIAEAFGVSESRICQIHGQAILALKNLFKRDTDSADTKVSATRARQTSHRRVRSGNRSLTSHRRGMSPVPALSSSRLGSVSVMAA
jgi:RNA polymerase sigma factor for flagellar operon FliA